MQFNLKRFLIFAIVILGGGYAGNFVNAYMGFSAGESILMFGAAMFVPLLITYVIWEYWGQQASKA